MAKPGEALRKHREWRGKVGTKVLVPLQGKDDLSLAYTPGVAEACLAIREDPSLSFALTRRWNTVAVLTDGTAVLGLGDIGPEAGMPVMEGKCALFREFGGVDAVPICLRTKDPEEIVRTIRLLSGSFGGVNLEDISAPRCFAIERSLQDLGIPVFHDDQHGTAIVLAAGLMNALKVVGKRLEDVRIVLNGPGAAGLAIARFLLSLGARNIVLVGLQGILAPGDPSLNPAQEELALLTNKEGRRGTLEDALRGTDVFLGVSAGHVLTGDMVRVMGKDPIVFALANPVPEIEPEEAREAGAKVVATGSSEHPNQVNNLLCFPGLFRGALDAGATRITEGMMRKAAEALSSYIPEGGLGPERILPSPLDRNAHKAVAEAVRSEAIKEGVARSSSR